MSDTARLLEIMARLRDPDGGCPWDLEQTFETIARYTIEEAYEVEDAIRRRDMAALRDELGDLLLQVTYHARMAEEQGSFSFGDVVEAICEKMIRRHPHVFGEASVESAAEQTGHWEQMKAEERAQRAAGQGRAPSALDGVAVGLPALVRAHKLRSRARRAGFRWDEIAQVFAKLEEEVGELREAAAEGDAEAIEHELGDVFFAAVSVADDLGVDPEAALRAANARFESRLRRVEALAAEQGQTLSDVPLGGLLKLWRRAKV
jgi:MazG family protein